MASCLSNHTLSALIDGGLSADLLAVVESHIDTCDGCRKLVGALAASHFHSSSQVIRAADICDLAAPIPWQPPEQVAEYRILHPIGQGQTGQVYKAHDLELDRFVALKLLRSSEPDAASRERFRTEARAIARLRHPGVVGIYRTGDIDGRPYIVSEFISGRSLDRLERPISVRQVLLIGIGIARGLSAAHKAGVLHRDIKPANIVLSDDGEIKLLDFGLAKLINARPSIEPSAIGEQVSANAQASLTRSGAMVGTPRYMAPEVWRGEPATARSDIYSLGGVLYELCAGRPPFPQGDLSALRRAALNLAPEPLRTVAPTVDARLASLIMQCLERQPERRPADAGSLYAALDQIHAEARIRTRWLQRPQVKLAMMVGAGVAMAGLAWISSYWRPASLPTPAADTRGKIKLRRSVAILGFRDVGGKSETSWISTALAETLRTELAAGGGLRLISGENVAQMQRDLLLAEATSLGKPSLSKIRTYLGVDAVLLGAYTMQGATLETGLHLEFRLQDTATGDTLVAAAETINDGNLLPLVTRAGAQLRERLGLPRPDANELAPVRDTLPESPESARAYAEGLAALRRLDLLNAREKLEFSGKISPMNPMIHKTLAETYYRLGYTTKQREAAKKAFELSGHLRREDQLATEAFYNESVGNFSRAIEIEKALLLFAPDNIDYAIDLANTEAASGKSSEALSTIEQITRRFPFPLNEDPRLDIVSEFAYRETGDFSAALRVSSRAMDRARARGATYLFNKAQVAVGWALYGAGEFEKAADLLDAAAFTFKDLKYINDFAWARMGSGRAKQRMGMLSAALTRFESQVSILRTFESQDNLIYALTYCASVKLAQGHPAAGARYTDEALRITNDLTPENGHPFLYTTMGEIALSLGKLPDVWAAYARATSSCGQEPERCSGLVDRFGGRAIHIAGDVLGARTKLEGAIAVLDRVNAPQDAAAARLALAELLLDDGKHVEAGRLSQLAPNVRTPQSWCFEGRQFR